MFSLTAFKILPAKGRSVLSPTQQGTGKEKVNNQVIKRQSSIKFLGILFDENLSWKEHLKLTENKTAKNIGLICKTKYFLNKGFLLALYFSWILSCINYANLVWESTHRTCLRKINSQQKHALRLLHNKNRFYHSKKLFESCEILNVYELNLLITAVSMHKIKQKTARSSFLDKFEKPSHSYLTLFWSENYRNYRNHKSDFESETAFFQYLGF